MTDIERVIWAEVFARSRAEYYCDVTESGRRADQCVKEYRESPWGKEHSRAVDASDVETALVDVLATAERICSPQWTPAEIRKAMETRLGRPLRGAK